MYTSSPLPSSLPISSLSLHHFLPSSPLSLFLFISLHPLEVTHTHTTGSPLPPSTYSSTHCLSDEADPGLYSYLIPDPSPVVGTQSLFLWLCSGAVMTVQCSAVLRCAESGMDLEPTVTWPVDITCFFIIM